MADATDCLDGVDRLYVSILERRGEGQGHELTWRQLWQLLVEVVGAYKASQEPPSEHAAELLHATTGLALRSSKLQPRRLTEDRCAVCSAA